MPIPGTRAVVIGGGAVGAASAYFLARAGFSVTVVDAGRWGSGCSHGNCGLISRAHVLPLTEPGVVASALRSMFHADAPIRIKPRVDLALWRWLWQFSRHCTREHLMYAARVNQTLLASAMAIYQDLTARASFDCEWQQRGCLSVWKSAAKMNAYQKTIDLLADEFGLPATRVDGDRLCEIEPALKPGLAGGFLYEMDAHLRPDKLMTAWRRLLADHAVTIHENRAVTHIVREGDRARAVATADGDIDADVVAVATGALTPRLKKDLGCAIPIQPGKGYSITMPRPARCPTRPIYFKEAKVVATPMTSGYRLGSTMEFAGYDRSLDRKRLDALVRGAAPYLHEPTAAPVEEEWYGWRPMTYDGLPIIGIVPAARNVCIAAGHNMVGISMSPATGKLVAEILSGETPHIDPAPFSPDRF